MENKVSKSLIEKIKRAKDMRIFETLHKEGEFADVLPMPEINQNVFYLKPRFSYKTLLSKTSEIDAFNYLENKEVQVSDIAKIKQICLAKRWEFIYNRLTMLELMLKK